MSLSGLFKTYEGKTFLHQLDSRTKLISLFLISTLSVLFTTPVQLISLFVAVFCCHLTAKIPLSRVKYLYLAYPFIFFFIAVGQGLFFWGAQLTPLVVVVNPEGALLGWNIPYLSSLLKNFPGEVTFYQEGFAYGLLQSLRTATLLTAGLTLALTTHPIQILYALRKFKLPFELCFLISMSLRFIPQIMDEISENLRAQQARGLVLRKLPLRDKLRALSQICDTLILRWIQGVREMALAIDLRGFRLYPHRTFVYEHALERRDWIVLGLSLMGFIVVLVMLLK